jgi:hypothetical protein
MMPCDEWDSYPGFQDDENVDIWPIDDPDEWRDFGDE